MKDSRPNSLTVTNSKHFPISEDCQNQEVKCSLIVFLVISLNGVGTKTLKNILYTEENVPIDVRAITFGDDVDVVVGINVSLSLSLLLLQ